MNRITPEAFYGLLPAVHRLRDADQGEPLRALMAVLAREGAVVEENIEQLLDNLFIETCADWAAPYIGGTIGYRTLYQIEDTDVGNRAEVANTIGYRRRKGTAAVLEQLARDVTGWPAHVVEYFQAVATCQHMNHIRPAHHLGLGLHDPLDLEPLNKAFDRVSQTVDVRSIQQSPGRDSIGGTHNLQNIGLYLWRLIPMQRTRAPVTAVDETRFLFDALGAPRQLMNRPAPEDTIASISAPRHVPGNITRRALAADVSEWYPRAFEIFIDGAGVPVEEIEACDLSDDGAGWNHVPPNPPPGEVAGVRVDPDLGRIAFPEAPAGEVRVSFHTGFSARTGGGEYNRAEGLRGLPGAEIREVPGQHATIQAAINALSPEGGIVEIASNNVFTGNIMISVPAGREIVLRAADGFWPILRPTNPLRIEGGEDGRAILDGLVVEGQRVNIREAGGVSLKEVTLRHCTLVPGRRFTEMGAPQSPNASSLTVNTVGLELFIERCITGPILMDETTNADIRDSIVDAAAGDPGDSAEALAIRGTGGVNAPAGTLTIVASTVIGRITARAFPLVSNAILFARSPGAEAPVRTLRRQEGCMRFSWVPQDAITPRRYRCQPQLAIDQALAAAEESGPVSLAGRQLISRRIARWLVPSFTALSGSDPAYCQLRRSAPLEIRTGASDESEMGAYHLLFSPQRETNLRIRLEEYLRFGLEAGIFYET